MGRSPDANIKKINLKHALEWDRKGLLHRQFAKPPLKDTIAVPNNGYVVLRFRADNPGENSFNSFINHSHSKIDDGRKLFHHFFNFFNLFPHRLLAIPLSFLDAHSDWNESGCAYRNTA